MYSPNPKQAQQYKQRAIETASREEILLMLYDGAIRFLLIAKKGLEENNLEKFHNHLVKTQNIILEFMGSLDVEMGGETAKRLMGLYEYLHYRLVQANIKKDVAMVDEALGHLRDLKKTWEEAIRIAKREEGETHEQTGEASPGTSRSISV